MNKKRNSEKASQHNQIRLGKKITIKMMRKLLKKLGIKKEDLDKKLGIKND